MTAKEGKRNLGAACFCIPFSCDQIERVENLRLLMQHLTSNLSATFLISCQGPADLAVCREYGLHSLGDTHLIDCGIDDNRIHKSALINRAHEYFGRLGTFDVFFIQDVDIFCDPDDLHSACDLVRAGKFDTVLGYDGSVINVRLRRR